MQIKGITKHLSFQRHVSVIWFIAIITIIYKGNEVNIYIYNPFGQAMIFQNMEKVSDTPLSIDVSKLATGRYLLRVTSKGKRDETKQLIIAH